ncbi:hypothetical protein OPKNFCMD_1304 [Methylobacterium crusticola]|uniref:Uncharacterized protein n=1 Tax=Methylobacterium crusticola TaxID=1697972 RepID=A0ABQ4QTC9_9HYPH|nr:hypothetical protein [Methylobacterium crusticola]GJD48582.1 hypothetical protein OPKNFCMD_1304 [Methylobacterium crusticola]
MPEHDIRDIAVAALSLQVTMLRVLAQKGLLDDQDVSAIGHSAIQDVVSLPNAAEVEAVIRSVFRV